MGLGNSVRVAVAAGALALALAAAPARGADLPDTREATGFDLSAEAQIIAPGERVGLFMGAPAYQRTLFRWREPESQELSLTLEYSGAVEHRRFDIVPAVGYQVSQSQFGEWSLCLNGHVLWTGNLAPYLHNGETPTQPNRDPLGHAVDGAWRTTGFTACDHAFTGGNASGDVDLAMAGGSLVELGYRDNDATGQDPVMRPVDPSLAWRARLPEARWTGRSLQVKRPDGTTYTFGEVPLTMPWPGYYYNGQEGPRAFRLSRIEGLTGEFQVNVTYEYGDSGGNTCRYLHPTAVHVTDGISHEVTIRAYENLGAGTCTIDVDQGDGRGDQVLSFSEWQYLDRKRVPRHSYLFYLDELDDRDGQSTLFRYEDDLRTDAFAVTCADSFEIHARRLAGVSYSTGGTSTYTYQPLPYRPQCAVLEARYHDAAWAATGRTPVLAPMVAAVELRESAGGAPVQRTEFSYAWNQAPGGGPTEQSESYRYTTKVRLALAPQPFDVVYTYRKIPYSSANFFTGTAGKWATRLDQSSVALASGEVHGMSATYDAVPRGTLYTGTLLPTGRTFRVTAAGSNRLLGSFSTATEYDSLARPVAITNELGARTTVEYDDDPGLDSPWSGTGRYAVLLETRRLTVDAGTNTVLADVHSDREPVYGRVTRVRDLLAAGRESVRSFEYDATHPSRVVRITGPGGEPTELSYSPTGIPYGIDWAESWGDMSPTRMTLHPSPGVTHSVYRAYDSAGRVIRESDEKGRTTHTNYDACGRLRAVARPGDVMTQPPPTPLARASGSQLPPYDLSSWPSAVVQYGSGMGFSWVRKSYYPSMLESLVTFTHLDGLGRPVSKTSQDGEPKAVRTLQYDALGRVAGARGEDGSVIAKSYDELGRVVTLVDAAGRATQLEHHGASGLAAWQLAPPAGYLPDYCDVHLEHQPGGRTTLQALDARGNLRAVAHYGPGSTAPEETWFYGFDGAGRMRSACDPAGAVTTFDYDLRGNLRHVQLPGGATRTTVYDRQGRPRFFQDENGAARGTWTYTAYDSMDRPTQTGQTGPATEAALQALADAGQLPAGATPGVRYIHDGPGDPGGANSLTRVEVTLPGDLKDAVDYTHDVRQRVVSKKHTFAGLRARPGLAYTFDRLDRTTSITYPDGRVLALAYDRVGGYLATVSSGNRVLVRFTRDASGRPLTLVDGATASDWQYNALGLVAAHTVRVAGAVRFSEALDYDADGRRASRSEAGVGRRTLSRDAAGRLAEIRFPEEPGAPAVAYHYDAAGELDSVASDLAGEKATLAGDRVLRWARPPSGAEDLAYDARGNVVRRVRTLGPDTLGVIHLAFSAGNELLSVVSRVGGHVDSVTYTCDADGWRSRRTASGFTTYFLRDERGALLAELDPAGGVIREYVYADGRVMGAFDAAGRYTAYVTDGSGSVRLGVDETGATVFQQEFLPYGELARFEGADRPRLGFLGAEQDPETGCCYLRNREYDPALGRFLSPDPLRGAGAPAYGYAFGDPESWTDRDGLIPGLVDQPPAIRVELPEVRIIGHVVFDEWYFIRNLTPAGATDVFDEFARLIDRGRRELPFPGSDAARDLARLAGKVLDEAKRITDESVPRLGSVFKPPATVLKLDRMMVIHELVVTARAAAAIHHARGKTPAELEAMRLEAGLVLLAELNVDALITLGLAGGEVAALEGLLGASALMEFRGDLSDMSDQILTRAIPDYAQTSVISELVRSVGP